MNYNHKFIFIILNTTCSFLLAVCLHSHHIYDYILQFILTHTLFRGNINTTAAYTTVSTVFINVKYYYSATHVTFTVITYYNCTSTVLLLLLILVVH